MLNPFDIIKVFKQFIPSHKQAEIQDRIIDILAKSFPDERLSRLIQAYRSDAAFQDSLEIALRRAVQKFTSLYQDRELVDAVIEDTHFWDIPSVQYALQEIVTRPSSYLHPEQEIVLRSFTDVLPNLEVERVEKAIRFFLLCLTQEVIAIPQLASIYQVQFQFASLEQSHQLVGLQHSQNQLMATLIETLAQNQKHITSPSEPTPTKTHDNLPPRHGDFLGREKDMKQVLDALRSRWPLISIEGLGGMGKTTLATQVGYYCLAGPQVRFESPFEFVVWISAKDRPDQKLWLDEVLDVTARVLGYPVLNKIPTEQVEQKKEEVNQLLRSYRTLLVVDNFETIRDPSLETWIQDIPEPSKVLITSRTDQLRRIGTRPITLKGLEDLEALELIRNYAFSLGLDAIAVDREDVLLPLVRVTGGNPKVIGLALGYIKRGRLSLHEVIEHLHIASKAVNGVFDDLFVRMWGVMTKDAQQVLLAMTLFIEIASKEALGAIAELTEYYIDNAVEELVELKLLDVKESMAASGMFYSIHPLTRAFASARLSEAPQFEMQARLRWSKYYLNFAKSHLVREVPQESYWNVLAMHNLSPMDLEWPNVRSLLIWADQKAQSELLVELMLLLVHYMDRRMLFSERLDYAQKAAEIAVLLGRMRDAAIFRIDALGWTYIEEGLLAEAEHEIKVGLQIAQIERSQEPDVLDLITLANAFLARVLLEQGKVIEASAMIDTIVTTSCKPVIRSRILMVAGDIAFKQNDKERALAFYENALRVSLEYRMEGEDSELYHRLGAAYLLDIETDDTLMQAERSFKSILRTSHIRTIEVVYAKYGLARLASLRGEREASRQLAQEALDDLYCTIPTHRLMSSIRDLLKSLEVE